MNARSVNDVSHKNRNALFVPLSVVLSDKVVVALFHANKSTVAVLNFYDGSTIMAIKTIFADDVSFMITVIRFMEIC